MKLKLKFHNSPINQYTQIDRYLLIPKKYSDSFPEGEVNFEMMGRAVKTRVYDIFCDCRKEKHTHKIIDLRDITTDTSIENNQEIEISI